MSLKHGTEFRAGYPIRSDEGLVPINTKGKVLFALPKCDNVYVCKFPSAEIKTASGITKTVDVVTEVLVDYILEIPTALVRKPLS